MSIIQHLVFYGTLHLNQPLWKDLKINEDLQFIRLVQIKGTLYDLGLYPGLSLKGNHLISAGLYSFKKEHTLVILDEYESCDSNDSLYLRRPIHLEECVAWIYEYIGPHDEVIILKKWKN